MKNYIVFSLLACTIFVTTITAPEAISFSIYKDTTHVINDDHPSTSSTTTPLAETAPPASTTTPVSDSATVDRDPLTGSYIVPYYSQIDDITPPEWRGISCGIASLAMLIDFYTDPVVPDTLLDAGIASGAYISDAGWSHQGLINLAKNYDLRGFTNTMYEMTMDNAFNVLVEELKDGPVMVSVQYTFTPTNPIPHLVVITGVHDGLVYYADPADGAGSITIEKFQSSWKKRYIAVRPLKMTDK